MPTVNPTPRKKVEEVSTRNVIYPTVGAMICLGDDAITEEQARHLTGYQEEGPNDNFGTNYLYVNHLGKKVRNLNNDKNRPFQHWKMLAIRQDLLHRFFEFNGENMVIGTTGLTLSCQHRLNALIDACLVWKDPNQHAHWVEIWPTKPVMESMVVTGISEDKRVTRTLDNVLTRTFADVLFVDKSNVGTDVSASDRNILCRLTEQAVRVLWERTGLKNDPWGSEMTNCEAMDFFGRHSRLLEMAKHIHQENKVIPATRSDTRAERAIGRYLTPGYAIGMAYLMGTSTSDQKEYKHADNGQPSEKFLKFDNWNRAKEFWTLLAAATGDMKEIRYAIAKLQNDPKGNGRASRDEILAILSKAWVQFADGKNPTEAGCRPPIKYDEGVRVLTYHPTVGGIDLGKAPKKDDQEPPPIDNLEEEDENEEGEEERTDPTPEQIEALKEKAKADRIAKLKEAAEKRKNGNGPHQGLTEAGKKAAEEQAKASKTTKPAPKPRKKATK